MGVFLYVLFVIIFLGVIVLVWSFRRRRGPKRRGSITPFRGAIHPPMEGRSTAPGVQQESGGSTHGIPPVEMRREPVPAKLVSPELDQWYRKIEGARYLPLREGITQASFRKIDSSQRSVIEKRLTDLVPPPPLIIKLTNLLRNPQSNAKEITAIASKDPVLSARLLGAANSAYFGLPQEVTSVGRAIVLLGYNQVKALLFDDVIRKNLSRFRRDEKGRAERIWVHSVIVSACASGIGGMLERQEQVDWGTLGLLHDIGKYFLFLLKQIREPDGSLHPLLQEEERFGINHATLGALVAKSWNLPVEIEEAIEFHHYPAFFEPEVILPPHRSASIVIYLADHIARVLGFTDGDDRLYALNKQGLGYLRLGPELKDLVPPKLLHEVERVISLNEVSGLFPEIREIKGAGAETGRGDSLKMVCPKCDYDTSISPDLLGFGESFTWICPRCNARIVKRFSDTSKGQ